MVTVCIQATTVGAGDGPQLTSRQRTASFEELPIGIGHGKIGQQGGIGYRCK